MLLKYVGKKLSLYLLVVMREFIFIEMWERNLELEKKKFIGVLGEKNKK